MSKSCSVCGKAQSLFVMNNKTVCLRCDELLFDIEIELDEAPVIDTKQERRSDIQAKLNAIQLSQIKKP